MDTNVVNMAAASTATEQHCEHCILNKITELRTSYSNCRYISVFNSNSNSTQLISFQLLISAQIGVLGFWGDRKSVV